MNCCGFGLFGGHEGASGAPPDVRRELVPSGSRAFDEYRAEALRRLAEEQREFCEFLERLRMAKDKAEFDQFMAERRRTPRFDAPPAGVPNV